MSEARHVRGSELDLLANTVTQDGGAVRYLEGARHGLKTSAYHSQVVPGSGPREHTHPYAEVFVLHDGGARYFVGNDAFDAVAGDMVIVPAGMAHRFVNTGAGMLRQTAIHEAPVHAATYRAED
jgi:Thermophilic glucose-6-phosphate isomerase and related metalloenzymes